MYAVAVETLFLKPQFSACYFQYGADEEIVESIEAVAEENPETQPEPETEPAAPAEAASPETTEPAAEPEEVSNATSESSGNGTAEEEQK